MALDVITLDNGDQVATDKIGGKSYQEIKTGFGPANTFYRVNYGTPFPVTDALEVSRSNVPGLTIWRATGYSANIDDAESDLWDDYTAWTAPTTGQIHAISSTSSADTATGPGTGAWTVRIWGNDQNGAAVTEDVTLAGTSDVDTTTLFSIIYKMRVLTVGSGGVNAGDIEARAKSDSVVTAMIATGLNVTQMGIYKIPASKAGYIMRYGWRYEAEESASDFATMNLYAKAGGTNTPWYPLEPAVILGPTTNQVEVVPHYPILVSANTTLRMAGTSTLSSGVKVSGFIDIAIASDD